MKKIAIIGATGMLGLPVTNAFVEQGFTVRALVRNLGKAKRLLPSSVDVFYADLQDLAKLQEGLQGFEGLYLNLQVNQSSKVSDWCSEREGLDNAIQAAKNAGIKKIAYLSSIVKDDPAQANWWVYQIKKQAAEKLIQSGIPYGIFCPSCFMENLSELQIQEDNFMHISGGQNPSEAKKPGKTWANLRKISKLIREGFLSDAFGNLIEHSGAGFHPMRSWGKSVSSTEPNERLPHQNPRATTHRAQVPSPNGTPSPRLDSVPTGTSAPESSFSRQSTFGWSQDLHPRSSVLWLWKHMWPLPTG